MPKVTIKRDYGTQEAMIASQLVFDALCAHAATLFSKAATQAKHGNHEEALHYQRMACELVSIASDNRP